MTQKELLTLPARTRAKKHTSSGTLFDFTFIGFQVPKASAGVAGALREHVLLDLLWFRLLGLEASISGGQLARAWASRSSQIFWGMKWSMMTMSRSSSLCSHSIGACALSWKVAPCLAGSPVAPMEPLEGGPRPAGGSHLHLLGHREVKGSGWISMCFSTSRQVLPGAALLRFARETGFEGSSEDWQQQLAPWPPWHLPSLVGCLGGDERALCLGS